MTSGTVYLMNLSEYILLSRGERTAHIDLSTPCDLPVTKETSSKSRCRRNLMSYLGVEKDVKNLAKAKIHTCHLCDNNSVSGSVCVNPRHVYLGTSMENHLDKPPESRSEAARKASRTQTKEDKAKGGKAAGEVRKNLTPEERSEIIKRANASRTPESRKEAARKRGEKAAQRPANERSASTKKGWETRRANAARRLAEENGQAAAN